MGCPASNPFRHLTTRTHILEAFTILNNIQHLLRTPPSNMPHFDAIPSPFRTLSCAVEQNMTQQNKQAVSRLKRYIIPKLDGLNCTTSASTG